MVANEKPLRRAELPKSLFSLVLGTLATLVALLALTSLIVNPVDLSGGIVREVQGRLSIVFMGMIAGFGLGMASWMVACDAVPGDKNNPHWKMCRIFASLGTGFGLLAILVYLVFISLLPALLPVLN
jgi:hypothetical protein